MSKTVYRAGAIGNLDRTHYAEEWNGKFQSSPRAAHRKALRMARRYDVPVLAVVESWNARSRTFNDARFEKVMPEFPR